MARVQCIAISVTAVLLGTALPTGLGQTDSRAARSPATSPAATTRPAPHVELRFEDVYQLKDGEFAKFIPTPFIPSRAEHMRGVSEKLASRGQAVFFWTKDGSLNQWSFSGGDGNVASAFDACGIPAWEVVRREAIFLPLSGDWIIREDASPEQKVEAVQRIVRERVPGIRIEKRQVEQPVTIVRGKFDPQKHPEVYLTVGEKMGQNGGGSATLSTFLLELGNLTHHQFIDQTESGDEQVEWKCDLSLTMKDYRGSDLLDALKKETELTFTKERRRVSVYFISAPEPK